MFFDEWENCTAEDIFAEFEVGKEEREGVEILFAWYNCPPYEGNAYVLFRKDGKFYDIVGGHCSCFGLEGQWDPTETTIEALRMRCEKGSVGYGYEPDLAKLLDQLEDK